MNYQDFKAKYPIGSSIGKPFPPHDFVGECVSYVLTKCVEVDGVPFNAPMGHAIDIPFNSTFLSFYEEVTNPQVGDLMFWGDDPGTWTGPNGHTAIYDGDNHMMNQNFDGSRKISRNTIFTPGFIGYFRLKGKETEMTQQEAYAVVSQIYRVATDVDPEPGQADYWAKRIQDNPATAAELASALGGNDYKGDKNFRYYGRHYSEDMTKAKKQAYDEGLAAGGGKVPNVTVNGTKYVPSKG